MKRSYLIWCSAVLMSTLLIAAACSNTQNSKNTKNSHVIRFEDAPAIDRYRLEAAYEVHKNWVGPLNSKSIDPRHIARIKFKIMPDGIIQDIVLVKESGNASLDKAAFEAIKRTSPFKPNPKEISEKYVKMGLRFGAEGVK